MQPASKTHIESSSSCTAAIRTTSADVFKGMASTVGFKQTELVI